MLFAKGRKEEGETGVASGRNLGVTVRGSGRELGKTRNRMGQVLGDREQKKSEETGIFFSSEGWKSLAAFLREPDPQCQAAAMPSAKMVLLLVLFAQNYMGQLVKTPFLPVSHSHLDRARPGFSTASRCACVGHCGAVKGGKIRWQFPLIPASLYPLARF